MVKNAQNFRAFGGKGGPARQGPWISNTRQQPSFATWVTSKVVGGACTTTRRPKCCFLLASASQAARDMLHTSTPHEHHHETELQPRPFGPQRQVQQHSRASLQHKQRVQRRQRVSNKRSEAEREAELESAQATETKLTDKTPVYATVDTPNGCHQGNQLHH